MNIYTIAAPGVTINFNKCMIGIYNGVGSGQIVRVYRIWALNNQTVAVAGVSISYIVSRITTGSGGVQIIPTKHNSSSSNFPSSIYAGTNLTVTLQDKILNIPWSGDEPSAATSSTIPQLEVNPSLGLLADFSYSYTNPETTPLICREGYGIALMCITNTTIGIADFFMEVTVESE